MSASVQLARQGSIVFRYVVSSTEMRSIERAERRVYLGSDPAGRPVVWGEITGCGPACNANLAGLLLEYAMSAEGAQDQLLWPEASRAFVDQIARPSAAIAMKSASSSAAGARTAVEGLLESMSTAALLPDRSEGLGFAECPLCVAAASGGTQRVAEQAHDLFIELCRETVRSAAPGWIISCADLRLPGHPLRLVLQRERSP
jgi:hypothetical protein